MKIPCGRVIGHGESCCEGYLCKNCLESRNERPVSAPLAPVESPSKENNDAYLKIETAQAAVDKARVEFLVGEGWLFEHIGDLRLWAYPKPVGLRNIGKTILVTDTKTAMSIQAELDNDQELRFRLGTVR